MMNEEPNKGKGFLYNLWLDFANGTASDKLGIVSSLFTIFGVSGVYFYANISLGKILKLDLFQLSLLFLLTTLLIVASLLIIGGMIYASNPKNFKTKLSFSYFLGIILAWGIGLSLLSLIFSFYMVLIDLLFNSYVK
jgi:hypothetical protein